MAGGGIEHILIKAGEDYAPPEKPLVKVELVDRTLFLSAVKHSYDSSTKTTHLAQVSELPSISVDELLRAIWALL